MSKHNYNILGMKIEQKKNILENQMEFFKKSLYN